MKSITYTAEEIYEGFKDIAYDTGDLRSQLIKNGELIMVDNENDILMKMNGKKYWITTEPIIMLENKNCLYRIEIEYAIHERSKYSKALQTFTR